jgi:DedD protein
MAFFKSRKGGDEPVAATAGSGQATARQPESIEAMRRRAKHRLIGASVLVLVGVVGFPLLFDTQPRPISVDIPIEIPDRNKVKPLPAPAPVTPAAQSQSTPSQPIVSAPPATAPAPAAPPSAQPATTVAKTEARSEPKPEPKTEPKAEPKPAPAPDDGAKAQALLDGKPVATTPVIAEGRFVVQVGAFSEAAKAREVRSKLEHAGMKTYTQVVDTKDGKRIRVRVGPFASKADAEKAAERVKGLDLQAAVLTL